jgi:hypothetical protein
MRKLKKKVLEPAGRLSELLFELVIVLTLSCVVVRASSASKPADPWPQLSFCLYFLECRAFL